MTSVVIAIVAILVVAQMILPRGLAFLPLVIAAAHLGDIEILPELTPARTLILAGFARACFSGYFKGYVLTRLDRVFVFFSVFALISAFGNPPDLYFPSPFASRLGLILNIVGTYLYGRIYLPDLNAFMKYACMIPVILAPLALGMISEQASRKNVYYPLGGRSPESLVREGKVRAQGPFDHAILAGTCGATALPFAFLLWKRGRKGLAIATVVVCMNIVLTSASSGPLAAVAVSFVVVFMWKWREHLKLLLYGGVALAFFYTVTRGRGPWFLMASLDLVGGSTGWHRAELIDQAYKNLGEWWLFGTNYTRHWMASGVRWNPNMVDLTNYYIHLGVTGGLGLTLSLIAIIWVGFSMLRVRMNELRAAGDPDEIVIWCAGGLLATHAMGFVSISYFDQMYVFFYILVGAIPGLVASRSAQEAEAEEGAFDEQGWSTARA